MKLLYVILKGHWTFQDGQPSTAAQDRLQTLEDNVNANRNTNPFFVYVIDPITTVLDAYVSNVQSWLHSVGWTGPTLLATAIGLVFAGWRTALLAFLGFFSFGVLGLFYESMDTLAYTLCAVFLSVIIGGLVGIVAGLNKGFNAFVTPILDFMQILPSFAYLPLATLIFTIGPTASLVVTMIYAVPPVIRLTSDSVGYAGPKLFVSGEYDEVCPPPKLETWVRSLEGECDFAVIPGVRYLMRGSEDAVAALTLRYLQRARLTPRS
jgi:glycine betaine/proline transport system permease protein